MNKFTISNITESDIKNRYIRILKNNKKFFPTKKTGFTGTNDIQIIYEDHNIIPATYKIGSPDGKKRSGYIVFKKENFEKLHILPGDVLNFEVLTPNHSYKVLTNEGKDEDVHETDLQDVQYKVYLEERSALIESRNKSSKLFDRAILTLAAGAFGISLTFIQYIVPTIKPGTIHFLIFAWSFFSVSILTTLVSFLTSYTAHERQIEILEREYFDGIDGEENRWGIITQWLNVLSISFFVVGVVCLIVFSKINIT